VIGVVVVIVEILVLVVEILDLETRAVAFVVLLEFAPIADLNFAVVSRHLAIHSPELAILATLLPVAFEPLRLAFAALVAIAG